jgi:chloramphenicol 3-O phosphotransferase
LDRLPVLLVAVHCAIEVIWERRRNTWLKEQDVPANAPILEPIHRWQREVNKPGTYDMEVDTSLLSPTEYARTIRRHLDDGPEPLTFRRLPKMQTDEAEC